MQKIWTQSLSLQSAPPGIEGGGRKTKKKDTKKSLKPNGEGQIVENAAVLKEPEEAPFQLVERRRKKIPAATEPKAPVATKAKEPAAQKKKPSKEFVWRGRKILNVHQMQSDYIVTDFIIEEDGTHVAFVKKRHQLKSYVSVARLALDTLKEARNDTLGINFMDECMVALPGVKRTKGWYAFNKEIFISNVVVFFDLNARHNVEFARVKKQRQMEEEKICAAKEAKAKAAAKEVEPRPTMPKPNKTMGEREVLSVYEMDEEDVVTMMFFHEDEERTVYVAKKENIPFSHQVCRVGPDFKKADWDSPGMNFTHKCLRSLPGVKIAGPWFAFNTSIFIPKVVAFFDENSIENLEHHKRMMTR
ncbi:unnamed protein product, partial [Cuscuta europaea]